MATINYAAREISVKVVYYGPGLSGKTTNLQIVHKKIPPATRSDMVSLATEADRTLFFDFLPLDLGKIKGFTTKFQLYTVPGQVYYNATRKLVLRGVDGIVFVFDSAPDKLGENIESFQNMEDNLAEYGYQRESISIILQYNKRDLPNVLPVEEIDRRFNKYNLPRSEAIANKGKGVFESLKLIGKLVIDQLNKKYVSPSKKSTITNLKPTQPTPAPKPVQQQPMQRPVQPTQQPMQQRPVQRPQPTTVQMPVQERRDINQPPIYNTQEQKPDTSQDVSDQRPVSRPRVPPSPEIPQKDYAQYGNIDLGPMSPQETPDRQIRPASSAKSSKTDLDLEIERYKSQFNKTQQQSQQPPFQTQQPFYGKEQDYRQDQAGQQNSQRAQQPSPYNIPQFNPSAQVNAQQNQNYQSYAAPQRPSPMPQQQPLNQSFQNQGPRQTQSPNVSENFNTFQSQQGMQQDMSSSADYPTDFDSRGISNEQMYFTSVDTEKSRKRGKKPINPRHKQKKGLFGNLFKKGDSQ